MLPDIKWEFWKLIRRSLFLNSLSSFWAGGNECAQFPRPWKLKRHEMYFDVFVLSVLSAYLLNMESFFYIRESYQTQKIKMNSSF